MSPSKAQSVIGAEESTVSAVWPWQAGPYKLWSLLDMIKRFEANNFGAFLTNFERAMMALEIAVRPPNESDRMQLIRKGYPNLSESLTQLHDVCKRGQVPFCYPVWKQIGALLERLKSPDLNSAPAIAEQARITRQAILDDLEQHVFIAFEDDNEGTIGDLLEAPEPWGNDVATRFPDAAKDISAAGRCLVFREWTACVFHSMRTLEHGLRPMAEHFDVGFTTESWHAVLKGIEDGISELRNKRGLTDKDRDEITFYSEAATQFRYFKDVWRNHVSHGRDHYDDRDAKRVYEHVRDFMQHSAVGTIA